MFRQVASGILVAVPREMDVPGATCLVLSSSMKCEIILLTSYWWQSVWEGTLRWVERRYSKMPALSVLTFWLSLRSGTFVLRSILIALSFPFSSTLSGLWSTLTISYELGTWNARSLSDVVAALPVSDVSTLRGYPFLYKDWRPWLSATSRNFCQNVPRSSLTERTPVLRMVLQSIYPGQ